MFLLCQRSLVTHNPSSRVMSSDTLVKPGVQYHVWRQSRKHARLWAQLSDNVPPKPRRTFVSFVNITICSNQSSFLRARAHVPGRFTTRKNLMRWTWRQSEPRLYGRHAGFGNELIVIICNLTCWTSISPLYARASGLLERTCGHRSIQFQEQSNDLIEIKVNLLD